MFERERERERGVELEWKYLYEVRCEGGCGQTVIKDLYPLYSATVQSVLYCTGSNIFTIRLLSSTSSPASRSASACALLPRTVPLSSGRVFNEHFIELIDFIQSFDICYSIQHLHLLNLISFHLDL